MFPITGNVNFDHTVKMISGRFLYCKDTIFFSEINKYIVGRYFETMQVSCFSLYFHHLVLGIADDFCLKQLLTLI